LNTRRLFLPDEKINNDKIILFMARGVTNFNFMNITQQFVFLMINEDINIISFISDIVFENFHIIENDSNSVILLLGSAQIPSTAQ
jgi:hypothetical protein